MKKLSLYTALLIIPVFLLTSACAGRIPSAQSTHSKANSFFKKYGKTYKNTLFDRATIKQIEINAIKELALNLAEAETFVSFDDGHVARILITLEKKPPFGWKIRSWEFLDIR